MGKDTSEIRQDIEATRARMGDTVEALSYKTDVKARVSDAVSDRVETVKGSVSDAVGAVGRALGGARDRASDLVGDRVDGARDTLGSVADHARSATPDVGQGARRAVGVATENPLGLALGALAVGFLAGLTIPVSDVEAEQIGNRVGPLADNLQDQAKHLGSELVEHGKAALGEVRDAALQSAQTHGQQIADEAKDRAGIGDAPHPDAGGTTGYGAGSSAGRGSETAF